MRYLFFSFLMLTLFSCSEKNEDEAPEPTGQGNKDVIKEYFGNNIKLNQLENYAQQTKPSNITRDNTNTNPITNAKATLGRVLFYDKQLSIDNTVSCSSCHLQRFAFSDSLVASKGVQGGTTGRHSMRLVNARFAAEPRFFWDERAATLEIQTTMPIQDHAEMGYSGLTGRPNLDSLFPKLARLSYYKELFKFAYTDTIINEARMRECLSQFVRSIQSFDSKYDVGRAAAGSDMVPFSNFTAQENQGKMHFLGPPQFGPGGLRQGGGLGCQGCHRAPEFDIDPNSGNNGIVSKIGGGNDFTITRSPSLRDIMKADGSLNGPLMHTGAMTNLNSLLNHYNDIFIVSGNTSLDPRLSPGGNPQKLQMTQTEREALIAFLKTLTGTAIYTDAKWSNPFIK
jgi:cytochrome c peroxidase